MERGMCGCGCGWCCQQQHHLSFARLGAYMVGVWRCGRARTCQLGDGGSCPNPQPRPCHRPRPHPHPHPRPHTLALPLALSLGLGLGLSLALSCNLTGRVRAHASLVIAATACSWMMSHCRCISSGSMSSTSELTLLPLPKSGEERRLSRLPTPVPSCSGPSPSVCLKDSVRLKDIDRASAGDAPAWCAICGLPGAEPLARVEIRSIRGFIAPASVSTPATNEAHGVSSSRVKSRQVASSRVKSCQVVSSRVKSRQVASSRVKSRPCHTRRMPGLCVQPTSTPLHYPYNPSPSPTRHP